ncbi:transcriptional regulator [Paenibacillus baekrokdamisoli]|uniref:Transcriptional regulator n=1 Tax=Paenibacillus baekrokdamisoli TaxID=1712516 RepID=A0A3G9J816_9BACL|nr:helix-turn-helix transcriptional regulator [Paenibacillus baekrokdamisoli]MBB3067389.1 transcriptional regulator with XRE-family HTH domain [Paenibacillus baekrokdamisoli]BBH19424.1 transcriptional regulator [Paenibacillus baekrokdamisoli]
MSANSRRSELGDFLRTRRERLDPSEHGFTIGTRRRTSGLRREELAQVAGVSVSWYTWLEQGRDINVSTQVLESIARALRLDWVERRHLFNLALDTVTIQHLTQQSLEYDNLLQSVLDSWDTCPAYAVDYKWNIVGWNSLANRVFGDYSKRSERDLNIIWYVFTNPSQRMLLINWEREAKNGQALFRATSDQYADNPWFSQFIHDLSEASLEFREWWALHDIQITHGNKELNHPIVGSLFLRQTTLLIAEFPELKILLYIPLPLGNTLEKLNHLASSTYETDTKELQLEVLR